ncbi:putative protein WAVE-DAMPENED 2 isoform X1 [Iris pallida]|uniref:Uncharacterized protein n=1 Tax=Iris pallida TaxID=29817 RepID=A0AAX6F5K2_IRIPA|nr:putative protein WAVE-DAMPENED 2 isoform X1 [Iris pallida]
MEEQRQLGQVFTKTAEQIGKTPGKDANEDTSDSKETIQEISKFDGKPEKVISSASLNDSQEELPCVEKDIVIQGTCAEKKEGNLQKGQDLGEKKAKPIPRPNLKGKYTVPQPFSLATDKRGSREKNNSEKCNPSLSKSLSLREKSPNPTTETHTSPRLERISELRKLGSTVQSAVRAQGSTKVERSIELSNGRSKSVPKDKGRSERQMELLDQKVKAQRTPVESKKSLDSLPSSINKDVGMKKLLKATTFKAMPLPSIYHKRSESSKVDSLEKVEDKEVHKMQRISTFKASALPSFYRRKSPPQKPELVKIPLTRPKSPNLGPKNKSSVNNKGEGTNKVTAGPIGNTAKETMKNSVEGPLKEHDDKYCKVLQKNTTTCGEELVKAVVSSAERVDMINSN